MQLRADIQLRSAVKSMQDVVLPALDATNKPAQEQGQLILAMLKLLEKRMHLQHRFDCDELERLIRFSGKLRLLVDPDTSSDLNIEIETATRALDAALAFDPAQFRATTQRLRASIGAVLQATFVESSEPVREKLRTWVFELADEQLLRDRAWVIDQGWEPDTEGLPKIEALIR